MSVSLWSAVAGARARARFENPCHVRHATPRPFGVSSRVLLQITIQSSISPSRGRHRGTRRIIGTPLRRIRDSLLLAPASHTAYRCTFCRKGIKKKNSRGKRRGKRNGYSLTHTRAHILLPISLPRTSHITALAIITKNKERKGIDRADRNYSHRRGESRVN